MDFTVNHTFPAGLDGLWRACAQPDYAQRKYGSLDAAAPQVHAFRVGARTIDVELDRTISVAHHSLPAWTRPFVAPTLRLHQHTHWRRTNRTELAADIRVTLAGLPVRAHATVQVSEITPATTRMSTHWTVKAAVPLMRGVVEHVFAQQLRRSLDADHAFTVAYLAEACADA